MKKILGMGNALVDILIRIESDEILQQLLLPKGSMQLVGLDRSDAILKNLEGLPKSYAAGGSAANTIHGLAMMGVPAGYIGVVGEDEMGGHFVRDLIRAGVEPHLVHSRNDTGRAVALITPDSERTFATFLGAAVELGQEMVNSKLSGVFNHYSYFHLEGYLVQNQELVRSAVNAARAAGLTISIDMASYNVVEANRDFLLEVVREFIDIVFANEDEARALTGLEPEEAVEALGEMADIAVVKTGANGSLIRSAGVTHIIGVIPAKPVDTTGAGDLYASGFLSGLVSGRPLTECGRLGSLLAGNVIEVMGAKMPDERWDLIRSMA